MSNLYIHCGLPKTGTTSLQKYLASSRQALRSHGYDYPELGISADGAAHHNISREILGSSTFDPKRGGTNELLAYLQRADRGVDVILSSEGLTHCLLRTRSRLLAFMRSLLVLDYRVVIVFTFRKFWKIAESSYLDHLRNGHPDLGPEQARRIARTKKWLSDLARGLAELREAIGESEFVACDVEKTGDIIMAFGLATGLAELPRHDRDRHFNPRLGLKKAALLHTVQCGLRHPDSPLLSKTERAMIRRRILTLPEFADDQFDYKLIGRQDANVIQRAASQQLPEFVLRDIPCSVAEENLPYETVDLTTVAFSKEDIDAVRGALPGHLQNKIPEWELWR